ncbi:superinfection immunity protein [Cellulomonas sp. JH27-2]|uniref:superinfection immunity protein n=1 Tax=Cellulomonas sp. JH27-2 TaxID=2774139 RepID=UPI001CD82606|nr:superinfection immunity protein [Cellulomonas sp. JH27-2]
MSEQDEDDPRTEPVRAVPITSLGGPTVELGKASSPSPPAAGPPTTPIPQVTPSVHPQPAPSLPSSQQPVARLPVPQPPVPQTPAPWATAQAGWTPQPAVVTDQRVVSGAVVAIAWVCAILSFGYMLPWAVAASRGRSNQAAIGLVNLFLGWSFIGWVVSLVMACQAHAVRMVAPVNVMLAAQVVAQPGTAPAGWYPSPAGYGQEYWDGQRWTGHRAP